MPCPGKAAFESYAKGTLTHEAAKVIRSHAQTCPACRLRLAEVTAEAAGVKSADDVLDTEPPRRQNRRVHFYDVNSAETLPELDQPKRGRVSTRARTGRMQRGGLLDGKYQLEALISAGGMARVFRAKHRELGRTVAIKLVLEGLKDDARMRELFYTEARIASSLQHPHIGAVTDFGFDDSLGFFLVMDLLEGESLRARMHRVWPPRRVTAELLDQTAGAVRYIHERGIVHCDLKPENIFLARLPDERGTHVKLIDFGLSFRVDALPGSPAGTLPYMAPERLDGGAPTPLCDVYSLGVIAYELVARRRPFEGNPLERRKKDQEPPPPSTVEPQGEGKDDRLDALILRALAADPAERQPGAEAFAFELRTWMAMRGHRAARLVLPRAGELTALADGPLPLALFSRDGALRFANRAFLSRLDSERAEASSFFELAVVALDRKLQEAFRAAATDGRQVRRPLILPGGRGAGTLVLMPADDGVHASFVDGVGGA